MSDYLIDVQGLATQFKTPNGIVHAVHSVFLGEVFFAGKALLKVLTEKIRQVRGALIGAERFS